MLLVRIQPNVDQARLIDSIVHHQVVINSVVNRSVNDDSEDVKDLVDNVVLSIPSGRQGGTGESSLETSVGTAGAMGSADRHRPSYRQ